MTPDLKRRNLEKSAYITKLEAERDRLRSDLDRWKAEWLRAAKECDQLRDQVTGLEEFGRLQTELVDRYRAALGEIAGLQDYWGNAGKPLGEMFRAIEAVVERALNSSYPHTESDVPTPSHMCPTCGAMEFRQIAKYDPDDRAQNTHSTTEDEM